MTKSECRMVDAKNYQCNVGSSNKIFFSGTYNIQNHQSGSTNGDGGEIKKNKLAYDRHIRNYWKRQGAVYMLYQKELRMGNIGFIKTYNKIRKECLRIEYI